MKSSRTASTMQPVPNLLPAVDISCDSCLTYCWNLELMIQCSIRTEKQGRQHVRLRFTSHHECASHKGLSRLTPSFTEEMSGSNSQGCNEVLGSFFWGLIHCSLESTIWKCRTVKMLFSNNKLCLCLRFPWQNSAHLLRSAAFHLIILVMSVGKVKQKQV